MFTWIFFMFNKYRSQLMDPSIDRHRAKGLDMGYSEPAYDSSSLLRIHDIHLYHVKVKSSSNSQKRSLHKDRLIMTSIKAIHYKRQL